MWIFTSFILSPDSSAAVHSSPSVVQALEPNDLALSLALPLTSSGTLNMLLNLSVPWFSYMLIGEIGIYLTESLQVLNEMIYVKFSMGPGKPEVLNKN